MKPAFHLVLWTLVGVLAAHAAEKVFDFTGDELNQPPKGWQSALAGTGTPGDWQVIVDDVPGSFVALTPGATSTEKKRVIAQRSTEDTDERYPLLIYGGERFGDFTLTLRFKTVSGERERMAGVAFRLQDEKNFYVVRASSLGSNVRFYRVVDGVRDNPIGPTLDVPRGQWHDLKIDARGNRFRISLNGREVMPELTDNTFTEGRIALWTKSDSIAHFLDLRIEYTPREPLGLVLVREALERYPRVLDLQLYAPSRAQPELHVIAARNTNDVGQLAARNVKRCLEEDTMLAGKDGKTFIVTVPVRDRNGDPAAVLRLVLDRFPGQTVDNAAGRARPIGAFMEGRFGEVGELTE